MEPAPTANPTVFVTRNDLEALLTKVQLTVRNPAAGIQGPDSVSWKINRESALFLGAGRAALLQLAHPWVAAALARHSSLLQNPIARFHNTFRIVFTMNFGSVSQAFAAARSLHQLHSGIHGELPAPVGRYAQGSRYKANHIPALRWVFATLIDSAILAYECVLPPLTDAERATYYAESKVSAALFGIPASELPDDWAAFNAYFTDTCNSDALGVDVSAISLAHNLLSGAGSWIRPPHWFRFLTAAWMPPRFRAEFELEFGPREERAAQSARNWLPRLYRRLPATLRFTGPYHEARARLGNRVPGPLTRSCNRFWIGEPLLPFAD
jgi:uncharacterized protein (DUF2236 family)